MVEREVHRLGMQHLATFAVIGHLAGGQHPADILLVDRGAFDVDLSGQAVGPRPCPRETGNDMVDADIGHLLRGLHGRADRALGLLHAFDFAEAHAA